MGAWKDVSKAVRFKTRATAYYLKEKNRRAAVMNRLRAVIRCEEKAAEKEYLALGRYYYNALRDPDNPLAESHCARIDQINARRDSALESLEQASQEEAASIGFIGGSDGPTAVYKTSAFTRAGPRSPSPPMRRMRRKWTFPMWNASTMTPPSPRTGPRRKMRLPRPDRAFRRVNRWLRPRNTRFGQPNSMRMTACLSNKAFGRIWEWRS